MNQRLTHFHWLHNMEISLSLFHFYDLSFISLAMKWSFHWILEGEILDHYLSVPFSWGNTYFLVQYPDSS